MPAGRWTSCGGLVPSPLRRAGGDGIRLCEVETGRKFFAIGAVRSEPTRIESVDSTTILAGNGKTLAFYRYGEPTGGAPPTVGFRG